MLKLKKHERISFFAESASEYLRLFNKYRMDCDHRTDNNLNGGHNCFHGGTKTECNPYICPLKED